jgi:hypothetical protein
VMEQATVDQAQQRANPKHTPSRPGRMTAVMRAMQPAGPRVLRVGLFAGGRVIEERILRDRTSVTVGSSERSMFVVSAPVPPRFEVLEVEGDAYVLNVAEGMTGTVALSSGVLDLASTTGSARRIPLDDRARGKIVLGDATLLFQFVAPPPVQTRPRLPLSVKDGIWSQIDWSLAVIAAFSFLLHFGLVGGMYSDWGDSVVSDDLTVSLQHMVAPPPDVPVDTADAPAPTLAPSPTPAPTPSPTPAPTVRVTKVDPAPDPGAISGLLTELNRLDIDVIGSTKGGPNLNRVLAEGDAPPLNLDAILERQTRIGTRTARGLDLPGVTGPIQPGVYHPVITAGPMEDPTTAGQPIKVVIPPFDVHLDRPTISAPVANAEATIRTQLHPGARRCYQTGLGRDPSLAGKLMLLIHVLPSGEVDSASITSNTGLSPAVGSCIIQVARRVKFDPTGPSGATILVPFGFLNGGSGG